MASGKSGETRSPQKPLLACCRSNVAAAKREELQAAVSSLYSLIAIIPKDVSSTSG
jgi:hypothetical protein